MSITHLPPFTVRLSSIKVDELPKSLSTTPSDNIHLIYFGENELRLPLKLEGMIYYLPCLIPSKYELYNLNITLNMSPMQETSLHISNRRIR